MNACAAAAIGIAKANPKTSYHFQPPPDGITTSSSRTHQIPRSTTQTVRLTLCVF